MPRWPKSEDEPVICYVPYRGGFIVKINGKNAGKMIASRRDAKAAVAKLRGQVRPCLTCGRKIISEGPHHRLCAYCRARSWDY